MRNSDVWGPAATSWYSHQHTKHQQRAQLVSYWACSITPAPNISFYFFFHFCPHLPFLFIFLPSDKDNELEFSDDEKGIEGQGWKNENKMQKTSSLGLWEGGFPMLSQPLNDGAQESTCSVHHSGREEPGCQQLTTEWGLLTNKPIRSQWSRHKKPGHHLKLAKDNLPRIIPKLTIWLTLGHRSK